MNRRVAAAVIAALGLFAAACDADPPSTTMVASSSSSSSSVTSSAPTSSSTSARPPVPAVAPRLEAPAEVETTTAACVSSPTIPAGWDKDCDGLIDTDAPIGDAGCETTECLIENNRQGAEQGGPTTECASGEVRNEGGGNYSTCVNGKWNYVAPTFDPNSGDGYGPNQPVPPACVRFQYPC